MSSNRVEVIRGLCKQLRWHDEAGHKEYERTKATVTQRLLEEIDRFVMENFPPGRATADSMGQALDAVLENKSGDTKRTVAFSVDLHGNRFLILGVELWRGGDAIAEDAISFRAFRQNRDSFVPVASTGVWDAVMDVRAKPLRTPPISGEFWFFALGRVHPSLTPPQIAVRLWAFDGKNFRAVWTPKSFCAEGPAEAIELTTGGFVVNRLVDPTGMAARSPTLVVHEQFLLTTDGAQTIGQWETQRQ